MLRASLDELVAAFNRGSLDVPSGLLTPHTTFSLNDRSYESILGGSPDAPLIRLLARGTAGYRSAARALQYALDGATASVESFETGDAPNAYRATVVIAGPLRDSGEPFQMRATVLLESGDTGLARVEAVCPEAGLARLAVSRAGGSVLPD